MKCTFRFWYWLCSAEEREISARYSLYVINRYIRPAIALFTQGRVDEALTKLSKFKGRANRQDWFLNRAVHINNFRAYVADACRRNGSLAKRAELFKLLEDTAKYLEDAIDAVLKREPEALGRYELCAQRVHEVAHQLFMDNHQEALALWRKLEPTANHIFGFDQAPKVLAELL